MTVNNLYSADEIEAMKASGSVASKTLSTGDADGKVTQKGVTVIDATGAPAAVSGEWSGPAPRISERAPKVSQPNIRAANGSAVTTKRVTSPDLTKHLAEHERLRKEAAHQAELEVERQELSAVIDPKQLHNSLQVLDRKVRKLERENRELKKKVDGGKD